MASPFLLFSYHNNQTLKFVTITPITIDLQLSFPPSHGRKHVSSSHLPSFLIIFAILLFLLFPHSLTICLITINTRANTVILIDYHYINHALSSSSRFTISYTIYYRVRVREGRGDAVSQSHALSRFSDPLTLHHSSFLSSPIIRTVHTKRKFPLHSPFTRTVHLIGK